MQILSVGETQVESCNMSISNVLLFVAPLPISAVKLNVKVAATYNLGAIPEILFPVTEIPVPVKPNAVSLFVAVNV